MIKRLRRLLSDATPRPWFAHETAESKVGNVPTRADIHWQPDPGDGICQDVEPRMAANAMLIVEAINALPGLLDELEKRRGREINLADAVTAYNDAVRRVSILARACEVAENDYRSEEMPSERTWHRSEFARELLRTLAETEEPK